MTQFIEQTPCDEKPVVINPITGRKFEKGWLRDGGEGGWRK
jgi:hypothetical protein